jgi:hypothetical protein
MFTEQPFVTQEFLSLSEKFKINPLLHLKRALSFVRSKPLLKRIRQLNGFAAPSNRTDLRLQLQWVGSMAVH